MTVYRSGMEKFAQYYTADKFSQLLIDSISIANPKHILELGVGKGSLVKAAFNRWINASYYVADIDSNSLKKIRDEFPFVKPFQFDTVKENVAEKLNIANESIDLAICNPPYLSLKNSKIYNSLFEQAFLAECKKLKGLTTDIIFLAKNLQLLKNKGELGIILPDTLITGKEFQSLRSAIIQNHRLKAVIQLPEKIFPKTEALTHILIIEKGGSDTCKTPLLLADKNGNILNQIEVDKDSLIPRMDYQYHVWVSKRDRPSNVKTLFQLDADIRRGLHTHKDLISFSDEFIHTTKIQHKKDNGAFLSSKFLKNNYVLTQKGDILIGRVGAIGKATMVLRGKAAISDCIYRIRVKEEYRQKVWQAIISDRGQSWFSAHAHGVCAKVISKADLLNFPVAL